MTSVIETALFGVTAKALEKLSGHLPPAVFPRLQVDGADRDDFIRDWAKGLIGITLDAILEAARRYVVDEANLDHVGRLKVPNAASFARYARQVDFDHFRPPLVMTQQQPASLGTKSQIVTLQLRAEASLGSRELAQEVWGVLLKDAATPEQRTAVREGRVTLEEFDIAIAIVRESARVARRVPA